jgi:hypothetical protein
VPSSFTEDFKEVEFDLIHGEGISREGDVLDLAVEKIEEFKAGLGTKNQYELLELIRPIVPVCVEAMSIVPVSI